MIYRFLFLFIIISSVFSKQINTSNSIFYSSNSPRVNSLGGCIFSSNNISDVFNNPLNLHSAINNKTYFSFYNYLNNTVNVFQFTYKLSMNNQHSMNIGLVSRVIKNNHNTTLAWIPNGSSPEYEEIYYENIYNFKDEEISLLLSYHRIIGEYIINTKIKPNMHSIGYEKAFGVDFDFFISRNFNNLNFTLGLTDVFYKKWKNSNFEKHKMHPILSIDIHSEFFFTVFNITEYNTKIGLEYYLLEDFVFRVGLDDNKKYSYGFGVEIDMLDLNYSYYKINDLSEEVKQFSIAFNFK